MPPTRPPSTHALQLLLKWGRTPLEIRHFRDEAEVTIGERPDDTIQVPLPGIGRSVTLARLSGSTCEVTAALGQTPKTLVAGRPDAAEVKVGPFSVELKFVPVETVPADAEVDRRFLATLAWSGLISAFVVAAMLQAPDDAGFEEPMPPKIYEHVLSVLPPKPKKPEPKRANGGARHMNAEGKSGKPEAKLAETAPTRGAKREGEKRSHDREVVKKAGLLGAMDGLASNQVFNNSGFDSAMNTALNNLHGSGTQIGDNHGVGGMGARHMGPGGGGKDLTFGIGTRGPGTGDGPPSFELSGGGKKRTEIVSPPKELVTNCEREVVGRVIGRHATEIRVCYETELNKQPSLEGKLAVSFTITSEGGVSDASVAQSTLGSDAVEKCVLSKVARWRFPEPKGGGVCVINYPWYFHPAGQ